MNSPTHVAQSFSYSGINPQPTFLETHKTKIVTIALVAVALIATLATLEAKYGTLTVAVTWLAANPVATLFIVLSLAVVAGIAIYMVQKQTSGKQDLLVDDDSDASQTDNDNQEIERNQTQSTTGTGQALVTGQDLISATQQAAILAADQLQTTVTQQQTQQNQQEQDRLPTGNQHQTVDPPQRRQGGLGGLFSSFFNDELPVRNCFTLVGEHYHDQDYATSIPRINEKIEQIETHLVNFNTLYSPMSVAERTAYNDDDFVDRTGPQNTISHINAVFPNPSNPNAVEALRVVLRNPLKVPHYQNVLNAWEQIIAREIEDLNWLLTGPDGAFARIMDPINPFLPGILINKKYKDSGALTDISTYGDFWQLRLATCAEFRQKIAGLRTAFPQFSVVAG